MDKRRDKSHRTDCKVAISKIILNISLQILIPVLESFELRNINHMKNLKLFIIGLFAFSFVSCAKQAPIANGSVVKVNYKGTLADGTVFDTTENKQPLAFLVGANQVIPEFEKQVIALKPGQTKTFLVKAKDAYGEPDAAKVITLPKDGKFANIELKEGAVIFANNKGPNGQVVQTPMKVVKIDEQNVTLDYNHPLAGKDLNFEVTLVDVQAPSVNPAPAAAPAPAAEAPTAPAAPAPTAEAPTAPAA